MLLDKLRARQERDWYAPAATGHGWSRDVPTHQVVTQEVGEYATAFDGDVCGGVQGQQPIRAVRWSVTGTS